MSLPVLAAAEGASDGYVYGTVNLSYADFYYGEVNDVAENPVMDLTAADKTLTTEGNMYGYDAVSSCTTAKSAKYSLSYYDVTENSTTIHGMKDIAIAVPESLYNSATEAISNGESCNNDLLDIISRMTVISEAPSAYKVLNGDGTLGAITGVPTVTADGASASITTSSTWGQYQISVSYSAGLPNGSGLRGAVLETSDGSKYGLEHLDNLWLQAGEIAFAVTDGFSVPQGNTIQYKRFEDIVGKTITSITYMYEDQNIKVDNISLKVKQLLSDEYYAEAADGVYNAEGKNSTVTVSTPTDSSYVLDSVSANGAVLAEGTDYIVSVQENGNVYTYSIELKDTEKIGIAQYTVTFTDDNYEDISTTFEIKADMSEDDVKLVNNKLVITSDVVDVKTYIAAITSVSVNGISVRGAKGSTLFDENGNIKEDAKSNFHGNAAVLFPEEGEYEISVSAIGYPTLTGIVVIGGEEPAESTEESTETEAVTEPETTDEEPAKTTAAETGSKAAESAAVETSSAESTDAAVNAPHTGDSAPIAVFICLALLSAVIAAVKIKDKILYH